MTQEFRFDVLLSHSSKDKSVGRPLAEQLREDGLRVWFDERKIRPGDSTPAKIEEGLEHSRVLVIRMSANAFGPDWAKLESGTCGRGNLPVRDPLNQGVPINSREAIRRSRQMFPGGIPTHQISVREPRTRVSDSSRCITAIA